MSLFLTFEGPDGSGKSTQIQLTAQFLTNLGYDVLTTREPGGTAIGDQIRDVLHSVNNTAMCAPAEVLLYSASRAQLVHQVILPHLKRGGAVVCDRYADSTFAYQGYGRGLEAEMLRLITQFATQSLKPDLTIYLDLDPAQGLERKQNANSAGAGEWNRMDQLELDFHQRVRAGYLEMAQDEPERWLVIDATGSIEAVNQAIRQRLDQYLIARR
ncbi:MAG: dTMP kinase [Anaerolineae bacterium]|nr:dTMP kinase [Anaerolineae bacterium]MCB0179282.1 dTMP kinase [Anaerolineae bacterium]MCB0222857.1 dTMP kinase [Anaerolineae bacterium]MCB9102699.1 dTMP kinase [Anaerolineales bacterium]